MESEQANIIPREIEDSFDEPQTELDLLPEYCHYQDKGCEFADSCLNCPFVQCIYDQPGGKQHWLKEMRDREMARMFTTDGKTVKELALMFGVSQRTVQRALKNYLSFPRRIYQSCIVKGEDKKREEWK